MRGRDWVSTRKGTSLIPNEKLKKKKSPDQDERLANIKTDTWERKGIMHCVCYSKTISSRLYIMRSV